MSSPDIIALQERIAHQDAAIDELTRHSLAQAASIRALENRVQLLEEQLQELGSRVGQETHDAPPPHY